MSRAWKPQRRRAGTSSARALRGTAGPTSPRLGTGMAEVVTSPTATLRSPPLSGGNYLRPPPHPGRASALQRRSAPLHRQLRVFRGPASTLFTGALRVPLTSAPQGGKVRTDETHSTGCTTALPPRTTPLTCGPRHRLAPLCPLGLPRSPSRPNGRRPGPRTAPPRPRTAGV